MATYPDVVLHTERLELRPPALNDLDRWAEMMADEATTKFIGGLQPRSMVYRALTSMVGCWVLTGVSMFSVIERSSGRWMGRVGPWSPEGWPGTEVGWSLHPDAMGRGYASEAAIASIDYAFETLGWSEVIHTIDPANLASQRVAERLGSRLRGTGRLPDPFHLIPIEIWGQSREQWYAQREAVVARLRTGQASVA